jgi:hypothetical protein
VTRLTLTLAALVCCLSSATAAFSPRSDLPSLAKNPLPTTAKDASADLDRVAGAPAAAEKEQKQQFVITDETEVQLDGRACKFQDVPGNASVVVLDVAADKKTILKIHFKSKQ